MALLLEGWMTQPKIDEFAGLEYGQSGTLWPMRTVGVNALRPKPFYLPKPPDGRRRENMTLEEGRRFLRPLPKALRPSIC